MADNGKNKTTNTVSQRGNETALMIEGLYNGIAYDLHKLKKELSDELKYSSKQVTSAFQSLEEASAANGQSSKEELGAVCDSLKKEVESLKKLVEENAELSSVELKYGYQQNQMIFESLSETLDGLGKKADSVEEKVALFGKLEEQLNELSEKLRALDVNEPDYEAIAETVKEKVVAALPTPKELNQEELAEAVKDKVLGSLPVPEEPDFDKFVEQVSEKTEASVLLHSKEVLDAVAALPVPENVDYTRLVEEVSDKVLEKLGDYLAAELTAEKLQKLLPQEDKLDYDRVIYGTAEKVVESLPYPEKIDYDRIGESCKLSDEDALVEKIASAVLAKMPEPQPIDYDLLAEKVAQKIVIPVVEPPKYDVVVDEEGVKAIAEQVVVPQPEKTEIDYAALADELVEKMPVPSYEMLIDENGADMIATAVADKLGNLCVACQPVEEPVEEPAPVEEESAPVEEAVEEPVEEPAPVEETVEEIAVAEVPEAQPEIDYDDQNQLVDAESGLVIRLKRSFTAKLKQSAPEIKAYYSTIKNELDSYKRLNSNVSWHGDRFNFGRDTVAKMTINGKTLCFYLALDPANPEFKTTVYHQKDLSAQKAYENTPFMVKVKSETGAKRAVKLVTALAEKLGAVKDEKYEPVDYVNEFVYASTKELIDDGLIKVTKEKKVVLNFN